MGAQAPSFCTVQPLRPLPENMAPMKAMKAMKAMKVATSMSKGAIAEKLAAETGLKKSQCSKVMGVLADVAQTQVKKAGKFVVPGVCMVKTRVKPAKGGQEAHVRQGDGCQGEASQDCCQGIRGRRAQEVNLSPAPSAGDPLPRGPATGR